MTRSLVARRRIRVAPALVAALVTAIACLAFAPAAFAHAVGLSRGDYTLRGTDLRTQLFFARGDLLALVPEIDQNHDHALDGRELDAGAPAIAAALADAIVARADGDVCPRAPGQQAALVEEDGASLTLHYACPRRPHTLSVDVAMVDEMGEGHRHFATLRAGGSPPLVELLYRGHHRVSVDLAPGEPASADAAEPPSQPPPGFVGMVGLGIEHILTGYDHLLFLFGLVVVGGRVRSLIAVITAFTLAHSITLAAAALGLFAPSPRLIEPAIALSIAYVGVENFFVANAERRWRITFPFGLIHGFGFAGALRELALPRGAIAGALVGFNLGVEAGQLAVLALLLPLLAWARRHAVFRRYGVKASSAVVVVAGLGWFVTRVFYGLWVLR